MALTSTEITNTGEDIFLCPGTDPSDIQEHAVTCMIFCNTSASDVTLDLYAVASTRSVGVRTQIIKELLIPAGETFTFDTEKVILSTADRIHAVADVSNRLSVTVSSMRVS